MKTNLAFAIAMLRDPYTRKLMVPPGKTAKRPGKVYPRQSARQAQRYARQTAAAND